MNQKRIKRITTVPLPHSPPATIVPMATDTNMSDQRPRTLPRTLVADGKVIVSRTHQRHKILTWQRVTQDDDGGAGQLHKVDSLLLVEVEGETVIVCRNSTQPTGCVIFFLGVGKCQKKQGLVYNFSDKTDQVILMKSFTYVFVSVVLICFSRRGLNSCQDRTLPPNSLQDRTLPPTPKNNAEYSFTKMMECKGRQDR